MRTRLTLITHIIPWKNGRNPSVEMCDHCGERLHLKHILIECLLYTQERREIINYFNVKNKVLTVYKLLQDDVEIIEILIRYLTKTGLIDLVSQQIKNKLKH